MHHLFVVTRKQTNRIDHLGKELRCVCTPREAYDVDVVSWRIVTHYESVSGMDMVLQGYSKSFVEAH